MSYLLSLFVASATLTNQPALSSTLSAMPTKAQIKEARHQKIVVDISKRRLYFVEYGMLVKKYRVGVGKPKTPTPLGEGFIRSKGRMVFRYVKGPNKGKMIKWVTVKTSSGARVIKVPYSKIRGLGIIIPGYNPYQFYIHSTSDETTVDQEISRGCVRMRIPDMLELFPLIKVGAKIVIQP
ncbi:MAG: L,D-transpeptidase [bacterium]|nr:L,D-transpeptidase [bacterium]